MSRFHLIMVAWKYDLSLLCWPLNSLLQTYTICKVKCVNLKKEELTESVLCRTDLPEFVVSKKVMCSGRGNSVLIFFPS